MELTVNNSDLKEAAAIVCPAAGRATTIPAIRNVLLRAGTDYLQMTATNLVHRVTAEIPCQTKAVGRSAVPAALFLNLARSMSQEETVIESDGTEIAIYQEQDTTRLMEFPPDDFPIPGHEPDQSMTINAEMLLSMLRRAECTSAKNEERPSLYGASLSIKGDMLTVASADGLRLGVENVKLEEPAQGDITVIIPLPSLKEILRCLGGLRSDQEDAIISIDNESNCLSISQDYVTVATQLTREKFPGYESLIPKDHAYRVSLTQESLSRAIRGMVIFHPGEDEDILRLTAPPIIHTAEEESSRHDGMIQLEIRSKEEGYRTMILDASGAEGEPMRSAIKKQFLLDMIKAMPPGCTVEIKGTSMSSPITFRPEEGIDYTAVIMPIYLNKW